MEELTGNTHSEMLNLYVDGELDSLHEPGLFDELAVNEDLRGEMRDLLAIRNSVLTDSESFAVPVNTVEKIFNRVGLIPPIILPPPAAMQPIAASGAAWFSMFRNLWAPAIIAVVSIIGTSLILTNYYNNKIDALKSSVPVTSSYETNKQNNYASQNPIIAGKGYINTGIVKSKPYHKQIPKQQSIQRQSNQSEKSDLITELSPSHNFVILSPIEATEFVQQHISANHYLHNELNSAEPIPGINNFKELINLVRSGNTKYSLYLRGITARSFPEAYIPKTSDPLFTNLSIGTYISNSKNVQFGLEFGQESYPQFYDYVENGIKTQCMNNPIIFWGALGALIKTDRIDFLAGAQPFGQILFGGSQAGPIGKIIGGIQLNSRDMGIGIILGIEGSELFYAIDKKWYNTRKLGFTFGTSIHF